MTQSAEPSTEINRRIQAAIDKAYSDGVDLLRPAQRVVFVIADLDALVAMEGMVGYYHSAGGEYAEEVVSALERIGAMDSAALIREANGLFPGGAPPRDWEARRGVLWSLTDAAHQVLSHLSLHFLERPDALADKLDDFVLAHLAELEA